jgi:DNA mismatch repair protein MutS2
MNVPGLENAVRVLELDSVLERIRQFAASEPGARRLYELPFHTEPRVLSGELQRVTEMRDLFRYDDPFPLLPFPDLAPQIKRVRVQGALLTGPELILVRDLIMTARKVRRFVLSRREKYALLSSLAESLVSLEPLESEIGSCLEPTGEVKDSASHVLARIRREMSHQRDVIRRRLEHLLRSMVKAGYAQEESLTLRDGRLVIPMKDAHQGRLKGVVVDQSASGATVFMEPIEALELGNGLRRLELQERQEIERILGELTGLVAADSQGIATDLEVLTDLDGLAARAKYSISVGGNPARLSEDRSLDVREARHPLLLLKHRSEEVVPLSLSLGGDVTTLVITGPNAGGKTVALKTVGLLALMNQHGLHVPAGEETRLPVFASVFADIGDRQSIEEDLSTFSSHIRNLGAILENAEADSLVLLDEIGSATDPAEGGALAMGILKTLTERRTKTVATTHIGLLKVFAHDEPGVENGSMAFDQGTLKPSYRFQPGIPGSSYAFEIAERYGFQEAILRRARSYMEEDRGRLDRLVFDLEDKLKKTETLHREAEIRESRYNGLVALYESKLERMQAEAEERKKGILGEAEELLREASAMKERVLKELRESRGDPDVARVLHKEIEAKRKQAADQRSEPVRGSAKGTVAEGGWVTWRGHHGAGRVVSAPDRNGRVLVEWNDVRVRIAAGELDPIAEPRRDAAPAGLIRLDVERPSSDEIDLRGRTVDEAIALLDRHLPDAVSAGFAGARIIHGKGTGVLRREIGKYLETHPLVRSQRLGGWTEGDTGVTIVEFK